MNTITFPGLDLKFNIPRIAFSVNNINIYWYAILIVFAFIIALIIFKINNGKLNIKFSDILDLSIYVIPISILSARLYYILFNIGQYMENPMKIFELRNGGLAIYGGIIGGAITCYMFCKKRKISLLNVLDYITPGLALRTSNWKVGKLYKSRSLWRTNKPSMENGNI